MCNCGKKRREFSKQAHAGAGQAQTKTSAQTSQTYSSFEYTGKTALTLVGSVTRTKYRFNYPGAKQNIDYRDIDGVIAIPVLKKTN